MKLDYSVKPFEFLLGEIDFAPYLVSLSISPGISEIGSPYLWQGDFELIRPFNCPLADAEFSEFSTPLRWRRGLSPIHLDIQGYTCFTLRIDQYRYFNGRGRGRLIQVLNLAEFDRPSEEVTEVQIGASTPVSSVIKTLVTRAIAGMAEPPSVDLGNWRSAETYDSHLTVSQPVAQAQQFAGIYWRWLTVDRNETVRLVARPDHTTKPLFRRDIKSVEMEPDEDAIHFAADKVIVSGSYDLAVPYDQHLAKDPNCQGKPTNGKTPTSDQLKGLDSENRPRKTIADTMKPEALVFPTASSLLTPTLAEQKIILTRYGDGRDATPISLDMPGLTTEIVNAFLGTRKTEGTQGEAIATLTCTFVPRGRFTTPYTNAIDRTLTPNVVELETDTYKQTWKPKTSLGQESIVFAGTNQINIAALDLASEKREEIKAGLPLPFLTIFTPTAKAKECKPKPEPRQDAPQFSLETQPIKGEAKLRAIGWNTFLEQTYREDVGFLPNVNVANKLAKRIGLREIGRRDGFMVQMPVPIEWLQAHCPPFAICHIDTHALLIDAPILNIEADSMRLAFVGERLGAVEKVPSLANPAPFFPPNGIALAPVPAIVAVVGVAIAPAQLIISGGRSPYSFSAALPPGLTIDASRLISGTLMSAIDTVALVTVTDAAGVVASIGIRIYAQESPIVSLPMQLLSEAGGRLRLRVAVSAIVAVPNRLTLVLGITVVVGAQTPIAQPPVPPENQARSAMRLRVYVQIPN